MQTSFAATQQCILGRNFFEPQFAGEVAFHAMSEKLTGHTADRREFLGRNGSASGPIALRHRRVLRGTTGAGIDPCSVLQTRLTLKPGETKEVVVGLGAATGDAAALESVGISELRSCPAAR